MVKTRKTFNRRVFNGSISRTPGGISSDGIAKVKTKYGYRYVSKKKRKQGLVNKWIAAVMKARKQLGVKGFQPLKKGTELYKLAKELHMESKK